MQKNKVVVTGGAGFIGSALVWKLNKIGINDIIIVDNLGNSEKWKNLVNLKYTEYIHKNDFLNILLNNKIQNIETIFHMGACSSTTEKNADYLYNNNFEYTKKLAKYCLDNNIKFIYASSAATYGDGTQGFNDDEALLENLKPLNMYGYSKHLFDLWAYRNNVLNKITGLKFFNVYGPNEYHKGDMSSVIFKAFHQIKDTGELKLFKSYKAEYKDGEQLRDFIYVKDVVDIIVWLAEKNIKGIFNVGTGKARTWLDLANATFNAMGLEPKIKFIDMPENIKDKYQYFTQANIQKLRDAGYSKKFYSLEDGIYDYVVNYLNSTDPYLK